MSWTTQRGPANRGAASVPTHAEPATVVADWPTGAEVRQVVEFHLHGAGPAALVVAGSCLQAIAWTGATLWTDFHSFVTRILGVMQTPTGPVALVLSRDRDVRLVSLADGSVGWRHQAPAGTTLSGPGSTKLVEAGGIWLWLVAPSYAESISCFEITSGTEVRLRWSHDFAGRYDRGFGPVMVVADALGTGVPQVLISSRTGSGYGPDTDAEVPTERVVLGRADGHLYQAVLDLADGRIRAETAYRPDPGDYPCARPYGLLRLAGTGAERVAILVSCQVEEFYAATRIADGTLRRAWGEFVEKDWPVDEQELRPQTSSVAAADSTRPVLLTGHYQPSGWTTVLRDALTGDRTGAIPGHYFWGVVATGDVEFAVVSPADSRELTGTEPLRAAPVTAPDRISAGRALRPVPCANDILPPDISFHAERRSLLTVTDTHGRTGVLTTTGGRLYWWDPATDDVRDLAGVDAVSGYPGLAGAAVVVGRDGTLHRIGRDLRTTATATPVGRRPQPLAALAGGGPWILTPTGAGGTTARGPAGASVSLPGRVAAVTEVDGVLLVATISDTGRVLVLRCAAGAVDQVSAIAPPGRPDQVLFLDAPTRLVVAERTGVHTAAIGVHEIDGRLVWRDGHRGPHPNLALAAPDRHGRWLVGYDDHGVLVLRAAHTGELLGERDWTAAYTTPALVDVDGRDLLLRMGGVHGVEAVALDLTPVWRHTAPLWRYFPGEAAVADRPAGPVVACASAEGVLDLLDAATGRVTHSIDLGPVAARPPVIAVDVDGDGCHEFVAGTATGHLVTVDPDTAAVRRWPVSFAAAVEYLAAADTTGSGFSDLLVGTADGRVHVVRGR